MQGTSMSCPITASLCALMLSRSSTLTPTQILSCLQSTSQPLTSGSHTIATGKGIINAEAALNCVSPTTGVTANFTSSVTSGVAPLSVQFTNTSTGNPVPNSFIWAWGDGTSNTTVTTLATQTHVFNNPGSYTVTLTASNGTNTGTHTETITVTSSGGGTCDTLSNILSTESITLYTFGSGQWGTWTGHNSYSIAEFAEYYTGMTVNSINGLEVYVGDAFSGASGGNHKVTFKVYAGGGATPGTVLGTKDIAISALTPYDLNYIHFDSPVAFTGTTVYVGYQIYYNSPADTFSVAQAVSRTSLTNSAFLKNGATWSSFPGLSGNSLYSAIYVSPMVCSSGGCTTPTTPTVGTITQPTCTVSTGGVVLNSLPASGTWTITRTPGNVTTTGTGTTKIITGIPSGTYTFTVTDASSCTSLSSSSVFINSSPVPATPVISINGTTLHSSATTGNQWYDQNGPISGATGQNCPVTATGDYYVIVTTNGCSSSPSNTIHYSNSGVEVNENNNSVKVYPNPVSNELFIEIEGNNETTNFEIFNSIGQIVFRGSMLEKTIVKTSSFSAGVYLIKLESGKTFQYKKIVKE
jgi:PKD repeat protein